MGIEREESSPSPDTRFDTEGYAAFIGQIELESVWLASSRIANHVGRRQPIQTEVSVESRAGWSARLGGFEADQTYVVTVSGDQSAALEIEATFGLAFSSKQPMNDDLFPVFAEVNLPVNTWPYLREYVASVFGRVGWVSFTLPTLKRGVGEPELNESPAPPKRQRRRPVPKSNG